MPTDQSKESSALGNSGAVSGTTVPVLVEGLEENENLTASPNANAKDKSDFKQNLTSEDGSLDTRRLRMTGRNREDRPDIASAPTSHPTASLDKSLPLEVNGPDSASPIIMPISPTRIQSSSRVASPASSQIFERNVQEEVAVNTASSAIPSHIATENHIPSVLDASSMVITDDQLTPDTVEIVTHASHQPASAAVAGASGFDNSMTPSAATTSLNSADDTSMPQSHAYLGTNPIAVPLPANQPIPGITGAFNPLDSVMDTPSATTAASDDGSHVQGTSTYGSLDATDVRRLSFISFADVVHAEQVAGVDQTSLRDSLGVLPIPATAALTPQTPGAARSPSPIRSPEIPSLPNSPAAGGASPRFAGAEGSPLGPNRLATASPQVGLGISPSVASGSPPIAGGELTVETMRQALRKTGSGDLGGPKTHFGMSEDLEQEQGR